MPLAQARSATPLPVEETFSRVTDWERHAVPLTRIRRTADGFVARTGLGPIGFDDPMEVVDWQPPRFCRIEKRGRVVLGWAEIAVEPRGPGSEVIWTEELSVRGVPAWADPVVRLAATAMVRLLLRRTISSCP